jgi:hypothetical protein
MGIEPWVNRSVAYSLYRQRSTDSCEHYVAQSYDWAVLTPWNTVLFTKLIDAHLIKILFIIYQNRKFLTVLEQHILILWNSFRTITSRAYVTFRY